jgi:hypothetical protein
MAERNPFIFLGTDAETMKLNIQAARSLALGAPMTRAEEREVREFVASTNLVDLEAPTLPSPKKRVDPETINARRLAYYARLFGTNTENGDAGPSDGGEESQDETNVLDVGFEDSFDSVRSLNETDAIWAEVYAEEDDVRSQFIEAGGLGFGTPVRRPRALEPRTPSRFNKVTERGTLITLRLHAAYHAWARMVDFAINEAHTYYTENPPREYREKPEDNGDDNEDDIALIDDQSKYDLAAQSEIISFAQRRAVVTVIQMGLSQEDMMAALWTLVTTNSRDLPSRARIHTFRLILGIAAFNTGVGEIVTDSDEDLYVANERIHRDLDDMYNNGEEGGKDYTQEETLAFLKALYGPTYTAGQAGRQVVPTTQVMLFTNHPSRGGALSRFADVFANQSILDLCARGAHAPLVEWLLDVPSNLSYLLPQPFDNSFVSPFTPDSVRGWGYAELKRLAEATTNTVISAAASTSADTFVAVRASLDGRVLGFDQEEVRTLVLSTAVRAGTSQLMRVVIESVGAVAEDKTYIAEAAMARDQDAAQVLVNALLGRPGVPGVAGPFGRNVPVDTAVLAARLAAAHGTFQGDEIVACLNKTGAVGGSSVLSDFDVTPLSLLSLVAATGTYETMDSAIRSYLASRADAVAAILISDDARLAFDAALLDAVAIGVVAVNTDTIETALRFLGRVDSRLLNLVDRVFAMLVVRDDPSCFLATQVHPDFRDLSLEDKASIAKVMLDNGASATHSIMVLRWGFAGFNPYATKEATTTEGLMQTYINDALALRETISRTQSPSSLLALQLFPSRIQASYPLDQYRNVVVNGGAQFSPLFTPYITDEDANKLSANFGLFPSSPTEVLQAGAILTAGSDFYIALSTEFGESWIGTWDGHPYLLASRISALMADYSEGDNIETMRETAIVLSLYLARAMADLAPAPAYLETNTPTQWPPFVFNDQGAYRSTYAEILISPRITPSIAVDIAVALLSQEEASGVGAVMGRDALRVAIANKTAEVINAQVARLIDGDEPDTLQALLEVTALARREDVVASVYDSAAEGVLRLFDMGTPAEKRKFGFLVRAVSLAYSDLDDEVATQFSRSDLVERLGDPAVGRMFAVRTPRRR